MEFKTFLREECDSIVHAHLFEPLYSFQGNKIGKITPKPVGDKTEKLQYHEEYHLNTTNQTGKDIYFKLKSEMLKFKPDLKFNSAKYYISIVAKRSLAYIYFRKKKLNIVVMLPESLLNQAIKHHIIAPKGEGEQKFYGGECASIIIEDTSNLDEVINVFKLAVSKQLK
jgi:predicted transport protein